MTTKDIELTQQVDFTEAKRKTNRLENVHIAGHVSANGYSYAPTAYKNAIGLYENASVYLDHHSYSVKDKFAWLENVRHDDKTGLWGDLVANEKHPFYDQFMWWAENKPSKIGLSQAVVVRVPFGTEEASEIVRVKRVDIVDDPATTKGLFENKHIDTPITPVKDKNMELKDLDIKTLTEGRPDLVKQLTDAAVSAATKVAREEAVKEEAAYHEALSKVPEVARTDAIKTLLRTATPELRTSLITDLTAIGTKVVSAPAATTVTKREDGTKPDLSADELQKLY